MKRIFEKGILLSLAVLAAGVSSAMTMAELQSAVDAAEDGATVVVTSDVTYDVPLTVTKKVTIASAAGEASFVLRPSASYGAGTFATVDSSTADVTFERIVFDGQRGDTNQNTRALFVLTDGRLTLGNGAVIRNRYCPSYPAVSVTANGTFVMEEGSEIRGIVNDNYGIAVKTGSAGNSAKDGTFIMNGGLITECAGRHKQTENGMVWDGVVYLYGGTFYAHGGTICGNTSDYGTAGVCNYYGNLYVSGSFTATNNVGGAANDVCRCRDEGDRNPILIDGDYTGHMTLKLFVDGEHEKAPAVGVTARFIYTSKSGVARLGCENIVSEDDPTLALDFSATGLVGGWYSKWRKIVAKIAGKTNVYSFLDALDRAESGDTILLCQDYSYTWTRKSFEKDLTFASDVGGPYSIRKVGVNYVFADVTESTLTFRDIVLEGGSITNSYNNGFVEANRNGTIVLDRGAVIRNCVVPSSAAAVRVHDKRGAKLIMKEGSLIANCCSTNSGYGVSVCVGNGSHGSETDLAEEPPVFDMQGGVITGCTCAGASRPTSGYGGIVYVWSQGATFRMSGGAITGNVAHAETGNAGVVNYTGTVRLSGSALIEGGGAFPGLYNYGARKTYYEGDFRGRVEVSNSTTAQNDDQAAGKSFKVLPADASATGAWCFRAARSATPLVGKVVGGTPLWAEPIGTVGGTPAATEDDLSLLVSTTLDLSDGSADRLRLPILLGGAATSVGGSVVLTFDPTPKKGQKASSLALFEAEDGSALSGTWSFTLPAEADPRRWEAKVAGSACLLSYSPLGMAVMIR